MLSFFYLSFSLSLVGSSLCNPIFCLFSVFYEFIAIFATAVVLLNCRHLKESVLSIPVLSDWIDKGHVFLRKSFFCSTIFIESFGLRRFMEL